MDFCLLVKIWVKILEKIKVKTWVVNTAKNHAETKLIISKLKQMHLRLVQKE